MSGMRKVSNFEPTLFARCVLSLGIDSRVTWFRQRAARDRWTEEVSILEEELRRLTRGFKTLVETWSSLEDKYAQEGRKGKAAYAARKASLYKDLAVNAYNIGVGLELEWEEKDRENVERVIIR